jgi:hypothetical protein
MLLEAALLRDVFQQLELLHTNGLLSAALLRALHSFCALAKEGPAQEVPLPEWIAQEPRLARLAGLQAAELRSVRVFLLFLVGGPRRCSARRACAQRAPVPSSPPRLPPAHTRGAAAGPSQQGGGGSPRRAP